MRRQVDHHLARARAVGRRSSAHARAPVWPSLEAVERAVSRLYPQCHRRSRRRQAGGGAGRAPGSRRDARQSDRECRQIWRRPRVRDGRRRRPNASRSRSRMTARAFPRRSAPRIFDRGARLDTGKPGTGLGLAIVRDVAQIYGGSISARGKRGSGRPAGPAQAAALPLSGAGQPDRKFEHSSAGSCRGGMRGGIGRFRSPSAPRCCSSGCVTFDGAL